MKAIILLLLGAGVLSGLIYILWNKLYRMFFLLSVIILGGWYFWEKSSLWILIWGALTGFFALSSVPGVVANTQRKFYNMMKPKDKTAQEIIEGDGYYKKEKDTIKADRVVFGHTHFASSFKTPEKLFINSGCWIGTYLINWDEIPGNSNGRLIDFLIQSFGVDWVRTAKIEKIDDGRTILVSTGQNSLSLRLNDEKTMANLKIGDGRTDEFTVKTESDKLKTLNIYTGINKQIGNERRYSNTFVYIDESGAYLLSWINKDKIECIEAF